MKIGPALVAVLGTCGILAGCGGGPEAPKVPLRPAPSEAKLKTVAPVVEASNDFGLRLLEEVAKKGDKPNILISPISLQLCSALLLESAKGPERDEMKEALGLKDVPDAQLGELCQILTDALLSDPERPLRLANAVWLNREPPIQVEKAFADRIAKRYDGRIESSKGPSEALPAINAWVKDKTNGMIPKLLETLDPLEWVIMLNAVAFEARWQHEFDPANTKPMEFRTSDERGVQARMMSGSIKAQDAYEDDYDGVRMNYRGGMFSMVALLPRENSDPLELAKAVRETGVSEVLKTFRGSGVRVGFPKFKWVGDYQLNDPLQVLGIQEAFGRLDMSPLSKELASGMFLSRALQRTYIEVDEKGTRAAAAKAMTGKKAGSPRSLIFNRPFLYAIVHNKTGAILFLGICGDPTVER